MLASAGMRNWFQWCCSNMTIGEYFIHSEQLWFFFFFGFVSCVILFTPTLTRRNPMSSISARSSGDARLWNKSGNLGRKRKKRKNPIHWKLTVEIGNWGIGSHGDADIGRGKTKRRSGKTGNVPIRFLICVARGVVFTCDGCKSQQVSKSPAGTESHARFAIDRRGHQSVGPRCVHNRPYRRVSTCHQWEPLQRRDEPGRLG